MRDCEFRLGLRKHAVRSNPYFYGGYTTRIYGSYGGGVVDAIQCEFRYSYRDTQSERVRAAAAFAKSIAEFTQAAW